MEVTKMSSKGQVVIPESVREGIDIGTAFVVTKAGKVIVLKQIEGFTEEEIEEMKELDRIWNDIEEGKGISMSEKEFLKEMNSW